MNGFLATIPMIAVNSIVDFGHFFCLMRGEGLFLRYEKPYHKGLFSRPYFIDAISIFAGPNPEELRSIPYGIRAKQTRNGK